MNKDLSKRAKEIISQIQYVTIASVDEDGLPWNAPVFSAYDENYNFYWGTHKDSQKAKNIRANNNVFLVIYNSTVPSGTGEGVYVRAKVHEVIEPDEVKRVYDLLKSRHAPAHFWEWEAIGKSGPIRFYKAVPQKAWMNDDGKKDGHSIDIRTEITL
jgi:nitroimidazol reductase NimA-like FMN-containing flavoprotein (pyridoxamine 5'-phosphate oxidase superfamily)